MKRKDRLSKKARANRIGNPHIKRVLASAGEYYEAGAYDKAARLYEEILQSSSDCYEALNNLGLIMQLTGNMGRAESLYRRAIQVDSNGAEAYNNLGNIANHFGRADKALALYEKAAMLKPGYAEAVFNAGTVMHHLNNLDSATSAYRKALEYKPDYLDAYCNLGMALQQLGDQEQALGCFRKALLIEPDHPLARHLVASLEGHESDNAPQGYVKGLFDDFAEDFEHTLVDELEYSIPAQLRKIMDIYIGSGARINALLDLGCGTGLVGECFRDITNRLIGVDISPKMISEAAKKGIYDDLHAMDLVAFVGRREEQYSLVVAADVFVYLGDLGPLFAAVAGVINPVGYFVFSVESADESESGYVLRKTGRYAHSREYIENLSQQYKLAMVECKSTKIRKEKGEWIQGACFVLQFSGAT